MTAIVGLLHQGAVHLGADSAGIGGWALTVRADQKVFAKGPYVFGFTSSFRMGQLLRYALEAPAPVTSDALSGVRFDDLHEFMATTFVDAVRSTLKDGGWLKKESDREDGGTFLVGVAGRLFRVADDFQVGEAVDEFDAIGCGAELALGALYATRRTVDPRRRLKTALEAAERFSAGVRGPYAYATAEASA